MRVVLLKQASRHRFYPPSLYETETSCHQTGCAGGVGSSMRCFFEDPRLRLPPPPPPLLRRLGRGGPPAGRLLPPDVD